MKRLLLLSVLTTCVNCVKAQQFQDAPSGMPLSSLPISVEHDEFIVNINEMSKERRDKFNVVAASYRNNSRSVLSDLGRSMLTGGTTAFISIVGEELLNLTKVRSLQKKKWESMRNRECRFIDSLESVKGQKDFYSKHSSYGPLDPSNMNFDGLTFSATRGGQEVLRMVCSIDTTRLEHLFMHSKFNLVLDTLVFYPYRSYLPNLAANRIGVHPAKPGQKKGKKEREQEEYLQTISSFSYAENGEPTLNIRMELTSSWINELVQVFQDVKLGTFNIRVPIPQRQLQNDSVYRYVRANVLAKGEAPIDIIGDCFVVPRSYMPVSMQEPSWGTGEYKLKVVLEQTARYNPDGERAQNWHKDYKWLVRMQNGGKAENDYWNSIVTTFTDKSGTIIKAAYTPLVNFGTQTATGWINPTASAMPSASKASASAMSSGNMGGAGKPASGQGAAMPAAGH